MQEASCPGSSLTQAQRCKLPIGLGRRHRQIHHCHQAPRKYYTASAAPNAHAQASPSAPHSLVASVPSQQQHLPQASTTEADTHNQEQQGDASHAINTHQNEQPQQQQQQQSDQHPTQQRSGEQPLPPDPSFQRLLHPFKGIMHVPTDVYEREPVVTHPKLHADLLPAKDLGTLRGGRWPFTYDPVYGLPVVNEVATYGQVLKGIREGRVQELLWFATPQPRREGSEVHMRCLVRYVSGAVKQSVVPPGDWRMTEAMRVHNVTTTILPPEPRHVVENTSPLRPPARWFAENVDYHETDHPLKRRGPRIAPTAQEVLMHLPEAKDARQRNIDDTAAAVQATIDNAQRLDTEDYLAYEEAIPGGRMSKDEAGMYESVTPQAKGKNTWSDNIILSQDTQALIYKYVPIIGPIFGSAFIIGLYMLSRLVKGDLTDRMNMMSQEEQRRKQQQLKEVRMAFLEEELPALVAKKATLEKARRRAANINKKLGSKLEIPDSEVTQTYEACQSLLAQGLDLSGGEGSSSAAERMLAEEDLKERSDAQKAVNEGEGQKNPMDAMMEMGKLNTARIRKATDPRIMDVKRRVRQARRSQKRESKVQVSDEIIFFDDVAGNEQAKVELLEVVDFFRAPERFKDSGARAPKGVLLVGPPGNGKTLMARAVAGESGVAFISSSASEFIEMYMGLGAARVRDVFNTARKLAPCIIFIDELDAVGRQRRGGGQGNDERDTTVNQLLSELDGFETEQQGIVVMGATNRKDVLDTALTRPGRFDRAIEVMRPDFVGRLEGIKVHLRDKPISPNLDYKELAALTGGMSGAQIAGMCNYSSSIAFRNGRDEIIMQDLISAVEQSKYGRSYDVVRFVSPARKLRLSVMEASISLVATLLPAIEPVDYVTVTPSAKSPVGRTVLKPNIGRYTTGMWTKRYLREQLLVALAGRAGEELVFGFEELSSLNQHRIMMARQIAIKMLNAGMSEHPDMANLRTLGDQWYDPSSEPGRWTRYTVTTDYNQTQTEWIDMDMETEMLLNNSYKTVKEMLARNRECLDQLTELLVERERVDGKEVRTVVEQYAAKADLAARKEEAGLALL